MKFDVKDGELVVCEETEPACKFCLDYEDSLKRARIPNANEHFKVCLYVYHTRDRKIISRHMHKPGKLNYCPECGKKLKGVPR